MNLFVGFGVFLFGFIGFVLFGVFCCLFSWVLPLPLSFLFSKRVFCFVRKTTENVQAIGLT